MTDQRLIDADHAIRLRDIEIGRLRVEIGNLERQAIDRQLALDAVRTERAMLIQANGEMVDRIRELERKPTLPPHDPTDLPVQPGDASREALIADLETQAEQFRTNGGLERATDLITQYRDTLTGMGDSDT